MFWMWTLHSAGRESTWDKCKVAGFMAAASYQWEVYAMFTNLKLKKHLSTKTQTTLNAVVNVKYSEHWM